MVHQPLVIEPRRLHSVENLRRGVSNACVLIYSAIIAMAEIEFTLLRPRETAGISVDQKGTIGAGAGAPGQDEDMLPTRIM